MTNNKTITIEERYPFGKNWQRFIQKNFNDKRLKKAKSSLLEVLRLSNLNGYSFLDIGCGSGLHSLAALRSGASRVVSFDIDSDAVDIAKYLRYKEGNPSQWEVRQGSILDDVFMYSLPQVDIIYAWGVLHHTGNTWKALENSRIPLSSNGILLTALYSYTNYFNGHLQSAKPTPEQWLVIKRRYNKAGILGKKIMEWRHILRTFLWEDFNHFWSELKTPAKAIQTIRGFYKGVSGYKESRGMELWTDVRDWLGGWPMDFLKESEVIQFAESRLELELLDMATGEGNTEFIFRPIGAKNYWDDLLEQYVTEELPPPFSYDEGYCWIASVPHLFDIADDEERPTYSNLRMLENGNQLSFAHAPHVTIQKAGVGRYKHWQDKLYFSTSDNSNPNINGHRYTIRYLPSNIQGVN